MTLQKTRLASALNFQLVEADPALENPPEQYTPPEWVSLCPAGIFSGRDGRTFHNKGSQAIIDWIVNTNKKDIQWDVQHASELGGITDPAPAHGWTKAQADYFKIENGGLLAKVDWNHNGKWVLEDKHLRYYSPVFLVNPEKDKQTNALDIIGITSVGLTNEPNLYVPALNQIQTNQPNQEETPMDLTQLRAALGLESSATLDNCVTAVNQMKTDHQKALNTASGNPDMKAFAPRTELNTVMQERDALQAQLDEQAEATRQEAITSAINKALKEGKITPAEKDYYTRQCNKEGGLTDFTELMQTKAPVVEGDSQLNNQSIGAGSSNKELNQEEKAMADALGMSYDDFAAQKKEIS